MSEMEMFSVDSSEQSRRRHGKSACDLDDVLQTNISFASFDSADVGPVHACLLSKPLLGPAQR